MAILIGLACGVLSGFGIGGGSLLMVYLTAWVSMAQTAAQGINLLYFLPTSLGALIFHICNKKIAWRAVIPAALCGAAAAAPGRQSGRGVGDGTPAEALWRVSGDCGDFGVFPKAQGGIGTGRSEIDPQRVEKVFSPTLCGF